jgi:cysteinyl-tRNA synthetase
MTLRFHNTLSRSLEPFEPLEPGRAGLYTCGPTVYNVAHIGNFRAYLFEDLLRRHLEYSGFRVTQVMNLTDVDDKTIKGALAAGRPLREFTQPFKDAFFEDLRTLRIEPAEVYPAATDHIPEMIELVRRLEERGIAYRSGDGSVYFSIARFPAYGRLARVEAAELKPGARVAQDEYQKDNVADFVLWKAWHPDDGDVAWESPWGRGRPGWHLECSAMSMKYLGPTFDLHTGGSDNLFPHHENEIAQSEAATGRPFVRFWLHCAHLIVDGRKMSKSLGNFHTLRDLLARGYSGREVRCALLAAQYRQTLNFTFDALDAARAALFRLDEFARRMREASAVRPTPPGPAAPEPDWIRSCREAFRQAMDDDLNVAAALAPVFELVSEGNRRAAAGGLAAGEPAAALALLDDLDRVLGFLRPEEILPDARVLALRDERAAARARKDWARADALRKELEALGWLVKDSASGSDLVRKGAS